MNHSKDKFGFAVALLAAVLAFSAFKEGLKEVDISLVTLQTNLLVVAVWFAVLLSISGYCFALDFLRRNTKFESNKFLGVFITLADALYFLSMLLPLAVLAIWGLTEGIKAATPAIVEMLNVQVNLSESTDQLLTAAIGALAGLQAVLLGRAYAVYKRHDRLKVKLAELSSFESFQRERIESLYKQGFYSSVVLESYKLIEVKLRELLERNRQSTYGRSVPRLTEDAQDMGFLGEDDVQAIREVRKLRNQTAHHIVDYNKSQADRVLKVVKRMLEIVETGSKNKVEDS